MRPNFKLSTMHLAGPVLILATLISAIAATLAKEAPSPINLEQRGAKLESPSSSGWFLDNTQQVSDKSSFLTGQPFLDEDQPIVLNSVHSGQMQQQQQQHQYHSNLSVKRPLSGNWIGGSSHKQANLHRPSFGATKLREPLKQHSCNRRRNSIRKPSCHERGPYR